MLKIQQTKTVCDDIFVCFGRTEFGKFAPDSDEVIFKALNDNFDMTVNGVPAAVRECRVSAIPFNRPWPGKQRPFSQSESAGYVSFSSDEAVELRVKSKKSFSYATVRPLSRNISPEIKGEEVVFTLKEHGSYTLELDGSHNVLHIFFDPIKDYKDAEKATKYFGPGIHFPGIIDLRDNDVVYIDRDAIVFGSINSTGAKNVRIFGGGVIDNSCEEVMVENAYENFSKGCFRIYNCENVRVEDIILTNSSTWSLSMFNCKNISIENVKIVGQWRYNTDGIDIVNSEDVHVRSCFVRSFDDAVTLKAIYDYDKPMKNITVENSVFWCGWGKTCEIGIETFGIEYKDIIFRNCDLIHNSSCALGVVNGCHANVHDVLFENMRIEFQRDTLPEVDQMSDEDVYDGWNERKNPRFVHISNFKYAIRRKSISGLVIEKCAYGKIRDITFKNIKVVCDDDTIIPKVYAVSDDEPFENIVFEDISLNGEKIKDFESFETEIRNVNMIIR